LILKNTVFWTYTPLGLYGSGVIIGFSAAGNFQKKALKQESLLQSPSKMKTVKTIKRQCHLLGFAYFKF
jgi:hypothetical protein